MLEMVAESVQQTGWGPHKMLAYVHRTPDKVEIKSSTTKKNFSFSENGGVFWMDTLEDNRRRGCAVPLVILAVEEHKLWQHVVRWRNLAGNYLYLLRRSGEPNKKAVRPLNRSKTFQEMNALLYLQGPNLEHLAQHFLTCSSSTKENFQRAEKLQGTILGRSWCVKWISWAHFYILLYFVHRWSICSVEM